MNIYIVQRIDNNEIEFVTGDKGEADEHLKILDVNNEPVFKGSVWYIQ